jgi:hypothetical protein
MNIDFKHAIEILGKFWKSLCDGWYVIACIIGVLLLILSNTPDMKYADILMKISVTILVTSVFAAFIKWLSVHGIVKKNLNDILSSKKYLTDNRNFEKMWETIVGVSISEHNPHLKENLTPDDLRPYLPKEKELFYSSYSQDYQLEWKNQEKRIVLITETLKLTIKTKDKSQHKLEYNYKANMPSGAKLLNTVDILKLDNDCCLGDVKSIEKPSVDDPGEDIHKINYELLLNGKSEYKVHRVMRRELMLDFDPYILIVSGKHTMAPEVSFNANGTGIKAAFASTGTLTNFDTIAGKNNSCNFTERYPKLLLKGQGYLICMS